MFFNIDCDPAESWMWTRNGAPYIKQLAVWMTDKTIHIDGVTRRGHTLQKGGIRFNVEAMDKLAKTWLRLRNLDDTGGAEASNTAEAVRSSQAPAPACEETAAGTRDLRAASSTDSP